VQRRKIRVGRFRGLRDRILESRMIVVHRLNAERMRRMTRLRILCGMIVAGHYAAMTCAPSSALSNVKLSRQLAAGA